MWTLSVSDRPGRLDQVLPDRRVLAKVLEALGLTEQGSSALSGGSGAGEE